MADLYREYFNLDPELIKLIKNAEEKIEPYLELIREKTFINQAKVLKAFKKYKVSEYFFSGSSGYGYGDCGRQALEQVYADIFGSEDALVRMQFVSGTHAIATCLFALLKKGDTLVSVSGTPYDTLQKVIGIKNPDKRGTLINSGIKYREVSFNSLGKIDFDSFREILKEDVKVVLLQRSKGYSWRPAVNLAEIEKTAELIKEISPGTILFVDNCYGEFVETREPPELGADLIAGSLIKNPGGGLAPLGGYAAGHKELIELVSERLTAPGLGKELGATMNINRCYFQGFFLAPHVVGEAVKVALFAAALFEELGFAVFPKYDDHRSDIVQAIRFEDPEVLLAFCKGIQSYGPVDSFATPEPGYLAGYSEKVVMAAGTFFQGASLELSADAPYKPPYIAYLQGGLTFEHGKIGVMGAAEEVFKILKKK